MTIQSVKLTSFRTYSQQEIPFANTTIIVGPNTIGKTNILEAIQMISIGKSFRAEKDIDTIKLTSDFGKIEAVIHDDGENSMLTILLVNDEKGFRKKYLVNGISRRVQDFTSRLVTVLFAPSDLEIISEYPSLRRRYIDSILLQAIPSYRNAYLQYEKALRQRNRLLSLIQEGKRLYSAEEFDYWNTLLFNNGSVLTQERREYVDFINAAKKTIMDLHLEYDHSIFTQQRAEEYSTRERAAGITLIGPQRDDFLIQYPNGRLIKEFASRGEQRLIILQLKLLEIEYLTQKTGKKPVLLLDDIYSELDTNNIGHVTRLLPVQQTIITTTHTDYIPSEVLEKSTIINLEDVIQEKR